MAKSTDQGYALALVYSSAILALAEETKQADQVLEELQD